MVGISGDKLLDIWYDYINALIQQQLSNEIIQWPSENGTIEKNIKIAFLWFELLSNVCGEMFVLVSTYGIGYGIEYLETASSQLLKLVYDVAWYKCCINRH